MLFVGMISKSAPPSEMTVELTFERFNQQLPTATGCCHNSWEWRRAALAHSWCVWVGVWVGVSVCVCACGVYGCLGVGGRVGGMVGACEWVNG